MKPDVILAPPEATAPPLDTVLLWLTTTIERDFYERDVFPRLRHANAKAFRAAATLHYLTADEAAAVLEDAIARSKSVRRSTLNAYAAHIKSIQAAMTEAAERPAIFASPEAVCTHESASTERWRGTKDQLRAHGIQFDGPWPHEPGGKERWAQARDSRGYKASITALSTVWPGLYQASITIPYEVWAPKIAQKPDAERAERARRNLAAMPKSVEDFRAKVVGEARRWVRFTVEFNSRPPEFDGYRLADGLMERIDEAVDGLVEILADAEVEFDATLHAEIVRRHRAEIASADASFQSKMAELVKPNLGTLEGGAQ